MTGRFNRLAWTARQKAASDAPGRPWQWPWRRRRRRRIFGCLLWVLTLLLVLLVLSILFGGFQRGTRAGGGQVPAAATVAVQSTS
jgi:ABC-type Fe3+ transport system permease subunit